MERYQPEWLDELCLTGEIGWGRIFPPNVTPASCPMASLTRVAPVSIFLPEDIVWLTARSPVLDPQTLSSPAQELFELLTARGAMFAADLLAATMPAAGSTGGPRLGRIDHPGVCNGRRVWRLAEVDCQ